MERNSTAVNSPVRAWISSFLRYGYGVIPVGDGTWLESQEFRDVGRVAIPTSLWVPISKLFVIPRDKEDEYLDHLHRLIFAKGIVRFVLAVAVVALLLQDTDIQGIKEQNYYLPLLAISFVTGSLMPLLLSSIRSRNWIRKHGKRIDPTGRALKKIRSFNVFLLLGALLYGAFQGLLMTIVETRAGKFSAGVVDQTKDALEESAVEFVKYGHRPFNALIRAMGRVIIGLALLFFVTWGIVYVFDWIIGELYLSQAMRLYEGLPQQYDPKTVITIAILTSMVLLCVGGIVWGWRYLRFSMQ